MKKYVPKPGDVVTTQQIDFPMTVETVNENTWICSLIGFDPATQQLVTLPEVCMSAVLPVAV